MSPLRNFQSGASNALVVDDSVSICQVICATLLQAGFSSAKAVHSGSSALQELRSNGSVYQVLFIDLNMPGMDGIQLISAIAELQFAGGVVILSELDKKILELAGNTTKQNRVHLISCISKPITTDKVAPVLQKIKTLHQQPQYHLLSPLSKEELTEAIQQQQVKPYYQPIIHSKTGAVYCLEVLVRIIKPGIQDAISAGLFISVAEKNNLITQLSLELFRQAMQDYQTIAEQFGAECKLSLNISPMLLEDELFPQKMETLVNRYRIHPSTIILEITENLPVDRIIQLETLNRLRIHGFLLALDDYGTGFTNIRQLSQFPYTEIKVDRSLVYNIAEDVLSQTVVMSLQSIFEQINVSCIAEGVETQADLTYLNNLDFPIHLQGYIISKPKPLAEICRWFTHWKKMIR